MSAETTEFAALLDKHFTAQITPLEERALRTQLERSPGARALYAQRVAAAALDPAAQSAEIRIAQGLGLSLELATAPRGILRFAVPAAAMLAAAAALPFAMRAQTPSAEFASRGPGLSPDNECTLHAYRVQSITTPTPLSGSMHAHDELSFSYESGCNKKYLMVYATDEFGQVYWFHPAWTNTAENPTAIDVETSAGVHELRVATAHAWKGKHVQIHGLFLDAPATVREVEAMLQRGLAVHPGAAETLVHVEVQP